MKKKMIALLAGALMTLSASSAFAAFSDLSLVRVVYQGSTNLEVATDLGNVTSFTGTNVVAGNGADSFTSWTGSAPVDDLYVAYFAKSVSPSTATNLWLSTTSTESPSILSRKWSSAGGSLNAVLSLYSYLGGTTVNSSKTDGSSYWVNSEISGNGIGTYGGFVLTPTEMNRANLADLATVGYVDMTLYAFNGTVAGPGTEAMIIRTMADGTTIINPQDAAPVPIPAAAYLLGSGLLGLVGIRRKARK